MSFLAGTFFTPDKLYVWADTTLAAPLVHQTAYYYRRITSTTGTLHPTAADASNNTNIINLTTTGTGTQRIVLAGAVLEMLGRETTFTVDTGLDTIILGDDLFHGVEYVCIFESSGTLPAPLVAGTKYVILASQIYDYPTGTSVINLTSAGTGTHTIRIFGDHGVFDQSTGVNVANDTILTSGLHFLPRTPGIPLRFSAGAGTAPPPLVNGSIYYFIPYDPTHFRLGASRRAAEAGIHIDLEAAGSGNGAFESLEIDQDEMLGTVTGMVVQLVNRGNALPANWSYDTDYVFIRRGRGAYQIAATLQDALDGISLEPKPTDGQIIGTLTRHGLKLKRERRYTANGVIDTEQDTLDIEKALGACCAGTLLEPLGSGQWRLKVGAYPIPLGLLQLKDIRQGGQPELQCLVEGSLAATTVKGVYSSPLNFDHPSDIPAASDPAFVEEDGGEERILDVQYPFTNSKFMARRLARIDLRRKRMQRTLRLPAKLPAGFRYEYGDGVRVDLAPLPVAFDAELAGWNFQARSEGEGPPKPSIDLILRETDPWVYRE
jgi:hypothetical protein